MDVLGLSGFLEGQPVDRLKWVERVELHSWDPWARGHTGTFVGQDVYSSCHAMRTKSISIPNVTEAPEEKFVPVMENVLAPSDIKVPITGK